MLLRADIIKIANLRVSDADPPSVKCEVCSEEVEGKTGMKWNDEWLRVCRKCKGILRGENPPKNEWTIVYVVMLVGVIGVCGVVGSMIVESFR